MAVRCPSCRKNLVPTKTGVFRAHKRLHYDGHAPAGQRYREEPCPGSGRTVDGKVPDRRAIRAERRARRLAERTGRHVEVDDVLVAPPLVEADARRTFAAVATLLRDLPDEPPLAGRPLSWVVCRRCGRRVRGPAGHVKPGSRDLCR